MKTAHALRNRHSRKSPRYLRKVLSAVNSRFSMVIVVCLIAVSFASVALAAPPAAPNWVGPTQIESDDGYADLRWEASGSEPVDLFKIQEKTQGQPREYFLTGLSQLFYRVEPQDYEFKIAACQKHDVGDINCGPWSNKLTLTVTEGIFGGQGAEEEIESPSEIAGSAVSAAPLPDGFGGPDEMQPGMWWNPAKPGHGWSFYWANQLALPSMPSNEYDLYAHFFTYEAKTTDCIDLPFGEPCNPNIMSRDYRPVVLEAKLALENGTYTGHFVIHQSDGSSPSAGPVKLTFRANNKLADIEWSATFRFQSFSNISETIELLFDDGHEVSAPSDLSGHWTQSSSGFQPYVVENIGHDLDTPPYHGVEVVQVVFLDDGADNPGDNFDVLGRPTWIQAESFPTMVSEAETPLCFFHIPSGYRPSSPGSMPYIEDTHCNSGVFNAEREFTGYETERFGFWVNYSFPGHQGSGVNSTMYVPGGSVSIGTSGSFQEFQKSSNFHRVWFNGASSCELSGTPASCDVDLTWFTDGDFPQASVYAYDGTTREWLATSTQAIMQNQLLELTEAGSYIFELRMSNSPTSRLIARSNTFTVEQGSGGQTPSNPTNLQGQWISCPNHNYTISWSHTGQNVGYYRLEEDRPAPLTTLTHTVSPGTNKSKTFTKSSGPFGTYAYRVRACSNTHECSSYIPTPALGWDVPESCPQSDPEYPWGDNAYGGTEYLNQSGSFALGYHFEPLVDGQVVELGGLFNGTKHVKLFDRATQALLADVVVTSANQFAGSYVTLVPPVAVVSDRQYTVAMYSEGFGYSVRGISGYGEFPNTFDNVEIIAGTSASTSSNPNAIPTNSNDSVMYGQPDIGFVPDIDNQAPQFPNGVNPPGLANTAVVEFRTAISDPDPDTLTCTVSNGSLPGGLSLSTFGNAECVISGVADDTVQNYNFTLNVSDGNGGSASESVSWTMKNTPPFFDASTTTLQFTRGVQETRQLAVGDVDPGQSLTCSLSGTLPAGLSFSSDPNGTCVISGTTNVSPATYSISFSVSDGVTSTNSGSISLEVTN